MLSGCLIDEEGTSGVPRSYTIVSSTNPPTMIASRISFYFEKERKTNLTSMVFVQYACWFESGAHGKIGTIVSWRHYRKQNRQNNSKAQISRATNRGKPSVRSASLLLTDANYSQHHTQPKQLLRTCCCSGSSPAGSEGILAAPRPSRSASASLADRDAARPLLVARAHSSVILAPASVVLLEQEPFADADFGDDEEAVAVAGGAEEGEAPRFCRTAVPGSSACHAVGMFRWSRKGIKFRKKRSGTQRPNPMYIPRCAGRSWWTALRSTLFIYFEVRAYRDKDES